MLRSCTVAVSVGRELPEDRDRYRHRSVRPQCRNRMAEVPVAVVESSVDR